LVYRSRIPHTLYGKHTTTSLIGLSPQTPDETQLEPLPGVTQFASAV